MLGSYLENLRITTPHMCWFPFISAKGVELKTFIAWWELDMELGAALVPQGATALQQKWRVGHRSKCSQTH